MNLKKELIEKVLLNNQLFKTVKNVDVQVQHQFLVVKKFMAGLILY